MEFWKMAYDMGCIAIELLKMAVITEKNKYGDITKEQFKEICDRDFDIVK